MRAILAVTSLTILTLAASPDDAWSQSNMMAMQTGNDALETCSKTEDGGKSNMSAAFVCMSWVNGAVQASAHTISLKAEKPGYCTPSAGGSIGQYVDVYLKFLRENPAKRNLPAIYLFHQAMADAFPCAR